MYDEDEDETCTTPSQLNQIVMKRYIYAKALK